MQIVVCINSTLLTNTHRACSGRVVGGQRRMKLDPKQSADMITAAKEDPSVKVKSVQNQVIEVVGIKRSQPNMAWDVLLDLGGGANAAFNSRILSSLT